ncbi:hypothetical protein J42TS3_24040 [Paenibacillus vini]|uniref:Uncharacterized protein n=1 Tax=Paenibacillus vini TaxID=1476024 RepID=A0ABQ4MBK2_9BACL|nr:hypothetical protein J42TS3_24040 [Paenibacillus vini]
MKLKLRFFLESIIVSVTLLLFYYGFQMFRGLLLTKNYEPAIVLSHETNDQLQSSVSFGSIYEYEWVVGLVSFVLMSVVYYGVRNGMYRFIQAGRRN